MTITAQVSQNNPQLNVRLNSQKRIVVTEYKLNASIKNQVETLSAFHTAINENAQDGSLITYVGNTSQWTAVTEVENPNTQINGGHY